MSMTCKTCGRSQELKVIPAHIFCKLFQTTVEENSSCGFWREKEEGETEMSTGIEHDILTVVQAIRTDLYSLEVILKDIQGILMAIRRDLSEIKS